MVLSHKVVDFIEQAGNAFAGFYMKHARQVMQSYCEQVK